MPDLTRGSNRKLPVQAGAGLGAGAVPSYRRDQGDVKSSAWPLIARYLPVRDRFRIFQLNKSASKWASLICSDAFNDAFPDVVLNDDESIKSLMQSMAARIYRIGNSWPSSAMLTKSRLMCWELRMGRYDRLCSLISHECSIKGPGAALKCFLQFEDPLTNLSLLQLLCVMRRCWLDDLYDSFVKPYFKIEHEKIGPNATTALYWACVFGQAEEVKRLVSNCSESSEADHINHTSALFAASMGGHTDIVEFLLSLGADVAALSEMAMPTYSAAQSSGAKPLHVAAAGGFTSVVNLLINAGSQVDAVDDDEYTPLYYAARYGRTDVAYSLLAAGAEVGISIFHHYSPLCIAAKFGHSDVVAYILKMAVVVDSDKNIALRFSSKFGCAKQVGLLLDAGADVNSQDEATLVSSLHEAANKGHTAVVHCLLRFGARLEVRDCSRVTPLNWAISKRKIGIVRLLLSAGARMGGKDFYALADAVRFDMAECVNLLISAGADCSTLDRNGTTVLHVAIDLQRYEIANMLIEKGAAVNAISVVYGARAPLQMLFERIDQISTYRGSYAADIEMEIQSTVRHLLNAGAHTNFRMGEYSAKLLSKMQAEQRQVSHEKRTRDDGFADRADTKIQRMR